jgi:hypothetical protein
MMMRIGLKHIATLLGTAAVAASISAAPVAAGAPADAQQSDQAPTPAPAPRQPQQSCAPRGGATQYKCERPGGSVQLNDPPPALNYYSQIG